MKETVTADITGAARWIIERAADQLDGAEVIALAPRREDQYIVAWVRKLENARVEYGTHVAMPGFGGWSFFWGDFCDTYDAAIESFDQRRGGQR